MVFRRRHLAVAMHQNSAEGTGNQLRQGDSRMADDCGGLGVKFDEESRRIVVGTMNDAQDDLLDQRADVTDTAVVAVADYVFAGTGVLEVKLHDGTAYRIEVAKIGRSRAGGRIAILPGSTIVGLPDE